MASEMCLETRVLFPRIPRHRRQIEQFLHTCGLRYDDLDYYVALVEVGTDALVAGGGLDGGVIKCVAVADGYKGEAVANTIVSHLVSHANSEGHPCVRIFTKPSNRRLFESLSFRLLAEAPEAILMETGIGGIEKVRAELEREVARVAEADKETEGAYPRSMSSSSCLPTGCIVMNCNPFTLGHLYLIETAARQVRHLYVMMVRENCSMFDYAERKAMACGATRHLANVTIVDGSEYAVSSTTFPTYFLKRLDSASDTQMTLDLDLFRRHVAPALGVTVRFVGSEPSDPLTSRYNAIMKAMLPDVREISRLAKDGRPVSASFVRKSLVENSFQSASALVPSSTLPYLIAHLATRALRSELNTTPKPGLVDSHDNGAHKDMDHALMARSIRVLHPYFVRLSTMGFASVLPSSREVQALGVEAERAMMESTGGVNTYRGALFSMGLAVVASAHEAYVRRFVQSPSAGWRKLEPITSAVRSHVMRLALGMARADGTHGSKACSAASSSTKLRGALDNAREGYPQLFREWLPFYDSNVRCGDTYVMHKTLLRIMCDLDDTNIVFRTSLSTLRDVQEASRTLLADFSLEGVEAMNADFIRRDISPGGSADMLSLVVFLYGLGH